MMPSPPDKFAFPPGDILRRLGFLLLLPAFLLAREPVEFERISFEQGLFQSHITTVFQDSIGHIWIGTSDGLDKYDGYNFTRFRFDPLDPTSISGNHIFQIFEDSHRNLWVITTGGGINRLDPITEKFTHFRHDTDNPASLSDDDVTFVFEDSRKRLWIGTNGGGLNLFDRQQDNFIHFKKYAGNSSSISHNSISTMFEDSRGHLWIGTNGGGLNHLMIPKESGTVRQLARSAGFNHFYAQGVTYSPEIFSCVDSLLSRGHLVSGLVQPGHYQDTTVAFQTRQARNVLVVTMGEGNAFGMNDYGWIESVTGKKIWEMRYDQARHAGGATRNRIQIGIVTLPAGSYQLRYKSDGQHAHGNWSVQGPGHSELWGIRLLDISVREVRKFRRLLREVSRPNSLPHNWIFDIHEDPEKNLWLATADGLARLNLQDPVGNYFLVFQFDPANRRSLNHSSINRIHASPVENDPSLWIITAANGINRFNRYTGTVQRYSLNNGKVSSILSNRNQQIWVGTGDNGLYLLNPHYQGSSARGAGASKEFLRHFDENGARPHHLSNNNITSLFEDDSGIIWVGTRRGGLNKVNRRKRKFSHYRHISQNSQSLSHNIVNSIIEENESQLWIGTNGGLNKLTRDAEAPDGYRYQVYKHDPANPTSISSDMVSALHRDQNGDLWAGTNGGGLNFLERGSDRFRRYTYNPNSSNSISGNIINTIYEDQYGQVWIGTDNGLNRFDPLTGKIKVYRNDANDDFSVSDDEVWAIYEDSYSQGRTLWIGTRSGGINRFDRTNERFIRYTRDFDDPQSLNNPAILSIYQDTNGNLWFGTYSGGLNQFNRETEKFTFFTESDGLANNMIFGILEDRQSNLWLSTNKGISRFDPVERTFKNYDVYDGLQANKFNPGAYWRSDNGEMFFGGVNGFNSFQPDSVKDSDYRPPISITSFNVLNNSKKELLNRALLKNTKIVLPHDHNFISFEFAVLDYTNPGKNQFSYKLEGFDNRWMNIGGRRFVNFTNLDPGDYVFRLKGANSDGVWNAESHALQISITPPYWETWWFMLIAFGAIAFAVRIAYRRRVRYKISRALELQQVRANENERVRTKAAHDFHDELGHKLTRISLFSEILKRSLQVDKQEITDYLNRIGSEAKSLSAGMKDFIWTLDPDKDTLHEVAIRLKDFGDELFDKTGVAFHYDGISRELENIRLNTDWRRHLTLIFKEAMTNALKHANCQNVNLHLDCRNNRVLVSLSDDGVGLAGSSGSNNGSSGNGLTNMQLRAGKLNGKIEMVSNGNGGTDVRFIAPMPEQKN